MITDIYNFLQYDNNLLTSGQPTEAQFAEIAAAGVQAVINLALPASDNALPDERATVQALGMEYVPIPVIWEAPTHADLGAFMDALDARRGQKLYVHCAANYRVSCFVALYRVLRLGWQPKAAFAFTRRIWNPDEYPVWKAFIESVTAGSDRKGLGFALS